MYELIEHRRLDTNAAAITFTNIPQIYQDLVINYSLRSTRTAAAVDNVLLNINGQGNSVNITNRYLFGDGSNAASGTNGVDGGISTTAAATSNTFSNGVIYLSNYAGSTNKPISVDAVMENNATYSVQVIAATLWAQTAAITSIGLDATNGDWTQFSSATLYGVNRRAGIGRAPLAMGGYMSYSNGYWVHTFPSSGSFIPFTNMDVEYLVVAGGGGGGSNLAGGGGAGGLLTGIATGLTAGTNYSVTIGSGGAGATENDIRGISGGNSSFSSFTASGGGGGGSLANGVTANKNGVSGGSGGGGAGGYTNGTGGTGGAGTTGQGNAGGNGASGTINTFLASGGGGGAGEPGANGSGLTAGGNGGAGLVSAISGNLVFYAGGGGGGGGSTGTAGLGGSNVGGNGGLGSTAATNGVANRGGGGGGASNPAVAGAAGGSGIVIVRYRA